MLNEFRIFAQAFLLPIFWMVLGHYVFKPLEALAHKHLPLKIALALTKKRLAQEPK